MQTKPHIWQNKDCENAKASWLKLFKFIWNILTTFYKLTLQSSGDTVKKP